MTGAAGTCLVLGARGFVGSAVCRQARARGYRLIEVEADDYDRHAGAACDILINANGNSRKYLAERDPKLDFDLSVRSVLRSLHDFKPALYVHLSTMDVYPEKADPALNTESAPIEPERLSRYGFHKHLAEQAVRYYAGRWLIFRMAGFVGPGLWKNSIHDLLKGRPLRVHPDSQYQYLHTADLARLVLDAAESGAEGEIFNAAGDGLVRLREVAAWIPGCRPVCEPADAPLERYELNIAKIKARAAVPRTETTVREFVAAVLGGRETIR